VPGSSAIAPKIIEAILRVGSRLRTLTRFAVLSALLVANAAPGDALMRLVYAARRLAANGSESC